MTVQDRSGKVRTVAPLKEAKDTSWQDRILHMAVDCLVKDKMPNPEVNETYPFFVTEYFSFLLRMKMP